MDQSAVGDDGPFASPASNSNLNFAPVKPGTPMTKLLKPPKAPEKPLMPYMRFSRKVWDSVKAANRESKLWEIGRIIGQMWRELSAGDKQKFVDEYEAEKADYNEALKAYQNSPAYQQYLAAKEKGAALAAQAQAQQRQQQLLEAKESAERAASTTGGHYKQEGRVNLPPVDSESAADELDCSSARRVSATRFQRNQRLLAEVLGEACVPDLRSVVSTPRTSMLKRQAQSLGLHQKKLEDELEALEAKFRAKKRSIDESREKFMAQLENVSLPVETAQRFEEMVAKASADLLREFESSGARCDAPPPPPSPAADRDDSSP